MDRKFQWHVIQAVASNMQDIFRCLESNLQEIFSHEQILYPFVRRIHLLEGYNICETSLTAYGINAYQLN